jgi:hypothetical protein
VNKHLCLLRRNIFTDPKAAALRRLQVKPNARPVLSLDLAYPNRYEIESKGPMDARFVNIDAGLLYC